MTASDDPLLFDVNPTVDSIQSCLLNASKADVVLCIVDGRYGPPLGNQYGDLSATHVEVRHAREEGKPIFFFIRSIAYTEWSMLKRDSSVNTKWVEPDNPRCRALWTEFVSEFASLPGEETSNWFDQFRNVVDLKQIVEAESMPSATDSCNRSRGHSAVATCCDSTRIQPHGTIRRIYVKTQNVVVCTPSLPQFLQTRERLRTRLDPLAEQQHA